MYETMLRYLRRIAGDEQQEASVEPVERRDGSREIVDDRRPRKLAEAKPR